MKGLDPMVIQDSCYQKIKLYSQKSQTFAPDLFLDAVNLEFLTRSHGTTSERIQAQLSCIDM